MSNFVTRTVRKGTVKIGGKVFRPQTEYMIYDGRLDGLRMVFGRYNDPGIAEGWKPFVSLIGTVESVKAVSHDDPDVVDGSFPWLFWRTGHGVAPVTDPTLNALIAAYDGPKWTPDMRAIIADRLEELGDWRVEAVQAFLVRKYVLDDLHATYSVYYRGQRVETWWFDSRESAEMEIRRCVLSLFPEIRPARRTRAEVLAARQTVHGCCSRHADNQACECLEECFS